jgi:hypothetical protein
MNKSKTWSNLVLLIAVFGVGLLAIMIVGELELTVNPFARIATAYDTKRLPALKQPDSLDMTFTLNNHTQSSLDSPSQANLLKLALRGQIPTSDPPKLCTRDQVIDGQWHSVTLGQPPYVTPTVQLRCYPRDFYYDQQPWHTYEWYPSDRSCIFTPWRAPQFCQLVRYANILIAGDMSSWEHYSSLVQLLGVPTYQGYQYQSREFAQTIGQAACGGNARVLFRRDDTLKNLAETLRDAMASSFPSFLVLNRGAHYVDDAVLLNDLEANFDAVDAWLDQCREYGIKCHWFWRTTVPGHPDCSNFSAPLTDKAIAEALIETTRHDETSVSYHWYDFQHQNELVLKRLQERFAYNPPILIDAYHLNVLRPDAHLTNQNDCLHNCYPGKMDVYSLLMLHYLIKDRSLEDVLQLETVKTSMNWKVDVTTQYDRQAWEAAKEQRQGKTRNF